MVCMIGEGKREVDWIDQAMVLIGGRRIAIGGGFLVSDS